MRSPFQFILYICLFNLVASAQTVPFRIHIEPISVAGLGGLQSYAYGQHQGKWLIFGGRLDGLHLRQPNAAFDVAGNNNQIIVVDPNTQQKWTASLTSLSTSLQEQLSATNIQFYQSGEYLYLIGGYGYSPATTTKKTFNYLTAVHVPSVINAIINTSSFSNFFRQITDNQFAVTGGHLKKINNTFYLVGGNKFDGHYNPNNGPSFTQVYTDAIRKFTINDNGITLSVTHLPTITDGTNLHRRDYNVVPQILPNGNEGLTAFSGVFQPTVNLPFLNSVDIDSNGHYVNNTFQQYYNHYHCAVLSIYSQAQNEMHTIFFGGIAQYYDNAGTLVQDNNVPFVKTIARVTRNSSGVLNEYKLPIEMPDYLGASSEFIPVKSLPHYNNEVLKFDDFTNDSTLVGYIYGGISSTAPNIFFTNTGTQSIASSSIYKVYVIKLNALPVSIKTISAKQSGQFNLINWSVETKDMAQSFDVEYSFDGTGFTKAVSIFADNSLKYAVKDSGSWINNRIIFYRIKAIGKDGRYIYSAVVKLNNQLANSLQVKVYPNPTDGKINVQYELKYETDVKISLFNYDGLKVVEEIIPAQNIGKHVWSNNLQVIKKGGIYIISIETSFEKTRQIVVMKR